MSSREVVSQSVRVLCEDAGMSNDELARYLNRAPDYLRRKIKEGRWTLDDIDSLATLFEVQPYEIVRGFELHLVRKTGEGS